MTPIFHQRWDWNCQRKELLSRLSRGDLGQRLCLILPGVTLLLAVLTFLSQCSLVPDFSPNFSQHLDNGLAQWLEIPSSLSSWRIFLTHSFIVFSPRSAETIISPRSEENDP